MSLLKKLSNGISYNFIAVLSTRGLAVLTAVIIARVFGAEVFGLYSFLMAITMMALTLADFGMSVAMQKYLPIFERNMVPSVIGCAFAGKWMISLVISIALFVLDHLFGLLRGYGYYAALIVFFSSFNLVIMSLNAELKFKRAAIVQITIEGSFAAAVVSAAYFSWPVTYILISRGLSYLVTGLPVLLFFIKPKWLSITQEFHIFYKIMRFGFLSTVLAFLSVLFNQTGLIMLGFLNGLESTGVLKAALSLSTLVLIIPEVIRTPLFPVISNTTYLKNDNTLLMEIHHKILKIVSTALMPILLAGVFFAKQIITKVFGEGYGDAVIPFRILLIVNCLAAVTISYFSTLYMDGGIKTLIYIGIVCAFINLAVNYFLIPKYGPTGSAFAALTAQIVGVIWITWAFINKYGNRLSETKTE